MANGDSGSNNGDEGTFQNLGFVPASSKELTPSLNPNPRSNDGGQDGNPNSGPGGQGSSGRASSPSSGSNAGCFQDLGSPPAPNNGRTTSQIGAAANPDP